jgi:uncharacterized BrkB/YihY/UPF0761 family membrane protein
MQTAVYAVIAAFSVAGAAIWAVALADVFQRADHEFPPLSSGFDPRLFWTFVVIVLSAVGSFAYYFVVMRPYPRRRR